VATHGTMGNTWGFYKPHFQKIDSHIATFEREMNNDLGELAYAIEWR